MSRHLKKSVFYFSFLCLIMFSTYSCKKYEDGPGVSLVSKKARIDNVWAFESAIESDVDVTDDYTGAKLTLGKSGSANFSYIQYKNGVKTTIVEDGEWEFLSSKTRINFILEGTNGSYTMSFKIKELRSNSLHLISDELDKDWILVSNNLR